MKTVFFSFQTVSTSTAITHYNYIPTYVYIKYNDLNASNVDPKPSIVFIINAVILCTECHHVIT